MSKQIINGLLALIIILTVLPAGLFFVRWFFLAYPLPPALAPFSSVMAACMGLVGTLAALMVGHLLKKDAPKDNAGPKEKPPIDEEYENQKAKYREIANALWRRKEWYEQHFKLEGSAAIKYRTRVYIWRTAFVFAVFQFFSGLMASAFVAFWLTKHGHVDGTRAVEIPWYIDYLNIMLLACGAIAVPIYTYRRYRSLPRSVSSKRIIFQFGPLAVVIGGLLFYLQLTPELISFISEGSVNHTTQVPVLIPPIPLIPLPASISVPPFIYVAVQKLMVLPFISGLALAAYCLVFARPSGSGSRSNGGMGFQRFRSPAMP